MALAARKALLSNSSPLVLARRFRGKINIQRPKPPHYDRETTFEVARPWFIGSKANKTMQNLCTKTKDELGKKESPGPMQHLIAAELRDWLNSSRLVAFYHQNPMPWDKEYKAYVAFYKERMHFKKFGKETMRLAVEGTKYETVLEFYISRNMTVFSPEPDLEALLKISKKFPELVLMAAIYEGKLINKDEILYYSQIPDLRSAQAGLVQVLNSAGSTLVSQLNSHQSGLVANLEERVKQLQVEGDDKK